MRVEEHPHAYLVVGTGEIDKARRVLARSLPGSKRKAVPKMPCRPFWHETKGSCVAFYFAIGPGGKQVYKP